MKIAIIGATGFVGNRLIEMFHLERSYTLVPIVRNITSLARIARFNLNHKLAEGTDEDALTQALEGCDILIHSAFGNPDTIRAMVKPTYRAAQRAGVKRIVYLSSAAVHGQSPALGTDETTPLPQKQKWEYNQAKADAEKEFQRLRRSGDVELVMLRPSIIYGPRSSWITSLIHQLKTDTAYWIEEGQGILNAIYVDNLVHAIELAMTKPVDKEVFLINDPEPQTWAAFYQPFTNAMGLETSAIHNCQPHKESPKFTDRFERLRTSRFIQATAPYLPQVLKRVLKGIIQALHKPTTPDLWSPPQLPRPTPNIEISILQQCHWKYPNKKAEELLGYQPLYSFEEACAKTIAWLSFCQFPVDENKL
tara:strand:+ start:8956 stop:10047 length:1092 start_codon:yes stop_codon:yes gene_type:complete